MILRINILVLLSCIVCVQGWSQKVDEQIYSANDLYKKQEFEKAEDAYDKIIERDRYNTTAKFNFIKRHRIF